MSVYLRLVLASRDQLHQLELQTIQDFKYTVDNIHIQQSVLYLFNVYEQFIHVGIIIAIMTTKV